MEELGRIMFKIDNVSAIDKTTSLDKHHCYSCKQFSNHLHYVEISYQTYKYIPFYPTSKDGYVVCSYCKLKSHTGKMTETLWKDHHKILEKHKYPFWTYLGIAGCIAIFLGIIALLYTTKSLHNGPTDNSLKVADNIGNVIIVKEDHYYTSFKIIAHKNDSIILIPNKFSYRHTSPLSQVKEKDFLANKPYILHKDSVTNRINNFKVYKIIYRD